MINLRVMTRSTSLTRVNLATTPLPCDLTLSSAFMTTRSTTELLLGGLGGDVNLWEEEMYPIYKELLL